MDYYNETDLQRRFSSEWKFTEANGLYAVSKDGRLWRRKYKPDTTTLGSINKITGFHQVMLSKGIEKTGPTMLHRLIWETWNGPIPEGYTIKHSDNDKSNNALNNLELTASTEPQVRTIRAASPSQREKAIAILSEEGWTQQEIAMAFGVSQPAISITLSNLQRL